MVSFTVRMRFRVDDRAAVDALLGPLTAGSRAEPGCATYIPLWVDGEPATLVIWEQYVDEAAAEAHRGTEHFAAGAVRGLYQCMLEREVERFEVAGTAALDDVAN